MTVTPISSQVSKLTELDVVLEKDAQNRLMKNSLLKTKQISSFDKNGFLNSAEIDLLLQFGTELWAVEIKRTTAPKIQKGFDNACDDVQPTKKWIV